MRVILTVPSLTHASAGPSYTVPALGDALVKQGVEVEMHALSTPETWNHDFKLVGYPRAMWRPLYRLALSTAMKKGFVREARQSDVIHVNGVWLLPDVYPCEAVKGTACKVVYCPRGGLSPVTFKRGRLLKWLFWHLGGQKKALERVALFHAASRKEYEEIRALGFKQPIAIIPNGIDVPEILHKPFGSKNRKLVFFGRIHPTKAVEHLVEAWGRVAAEFPEWSLEIAGPDCGAVPSLKAMIEERKIPRVSFVGEFSGIKKYEFLASADLYVLPSLTENFGITIAEALVCGTPSIASKGCPWEGLAKNECGWWIDIGPDALAECLRSSLNTHPSTLEEMGLRGKAWMECEYTWTSVGARMKRAYEWILKGGEKPSDIIVE